MRGRTRTKSMIRALAPVVAAAALVARAGTAAADIYSYKDADGHTVYTNDPAQIPNAADARVLAKDAAAGAPTVTPGRATSSAREELERKLAAALSARAAPNAGTADVAALIRAFETGAAPTGAATAPTLPAGTDPQALVAELLRMSGAQAERPSAGTAPLPIGGAAGGSPLSFILRMVDWKSMAGTALAYLGLLWAWRLTKRHVPSLYVRATVRVLLVVVMLSVAYISYSRFVTRQIATVLGPGTGIESVGDVLGYVRRVRMQADQAQNVREQLFVD